MSTSTEFRRGPSAPFWVLWTLELWERFGYYGIQAILAVFFAKKLGYSDAEAILIFGSFSALLYGGPIIGGWIGDKYIGAKRTIIIGAVMLFLSYATLGSAEAVAAHLGFSEKSVVMYALGGVAIGGGLFKPNPSSLISKMYQKGDPALDSAMTLYYMAINLGSFVSMALTPIIAHKYSYLHAFIFCAVGMFLGLISYLSFYKVLSKLSTEAGKQDINWARIVIVIVGALIAVAICGTIFEHTTFCTVLVAIVAVVAVIYFFIQAFKHDIHERRRMMVALVLIVQGVIFFVLYQQMPTSLNFFAINNVNPHFLGMTFLGEQWQVLNPLVIVIASPILSVVYKKIPGTHVTKFCIGMSLCALAFIILYFPKFVSTDGIVSGWWMVATYTFQSVGELLISALGLSMVAELFPREMSGFSQGMWLITTMIAGPIGGWVGSLTAPSGSQHFTKMQSLEVYGNVFLELGLFVVVVAVIMWLLRGKLNRIIESTLEHNRLTVGEK